MKKPRLDWDNLEKAPQWKVSEEQSIHGALDVIHKKIEEV